MKSQLIRAIFACIILIIAIVMCVSCNGSPKDEVASQMVADEEPTTVLTEETTEPPLVVEEPKFLSAPDDTYDCQDDSVLCVYKGKTANDFDSVYVYYSYLGYEAYSQSEKNGSEFATLVKGSQMAHIYYLADRGELSVITSATAADTLPPKSDIDPDAEQAIKVTQMRDSAHVNGMCYVIELTDGSFIIYDGSYADRTRQLYQFLNKEAEDGEIVIRAWVLTHSHEDHYPAFSEFASRYAKNVDLGYVIVAPIDSEAALITGGDTYFNEGLAADIAKFDGTKTVYAHTGMEFTFGDLNMEILLAPDDLFKDESHELNFNNSSIVSRLYGYDYSFLLTGDIGSSGSRWLMSVYGEYLRSDICQVSHHGVEDVPLEFYEVVKAPILYYPCNQMLYDLDSRFNDVRAALREKEYTKEILIAGLGRYTREWGKTFDENAPLSMPGYVPPMSEE